MNTPSPPHSTRWAGLMLMACSVLSVVFIMYHPTIRSRNLVEVVEEFARSEWINGLVHGCLIALLWLMLIAFTSLSTVLGWNRLWVRFAFASFCLATLAMTAAALLSGFIIPEFVAGYHARLLREGAGEATPEKLQHMMQIMGLARAGNQVCSRVGVLCSALAWLGWSLPFLQMVGSIRWLGRLGVLAGLGVATALLLGILPMNVHGMLVYVTVQTVWSVAVGWHLWRDCPCFPIPGPSSRIG